MASLLGLFISQTHQRAVFLSLWAATFVATMTLLATITLHQVGERMLAEAMVTLDQADKRREQLLIAFDTLDAQLTAAPCSDEQLAQMRKVAFSPDDFSEFLYAPDGVARCSGNAGVFPEPVDLGEPNIATRDTVGYSVWLDRPLDFAGLPGLTGTVVVRGDFGIIVPPRVPVQVAWLEEEVVRVTEDGWIHRSGQTGLYETVLAVQRSGALFPVKDGAFHLLACDSMGGTCVATRAHIANLFVLGGNILFVGVAVALLISAWVAGRIHSLFRRYWALEARFRRTFGRDTIFCVYQPIIEVATGEVAGCEVLVRWRDLDGTVATPDRFLPLIERHEMTMQLTTLVVERAAAELSASLPTGLHLQVLFNIFPRDLDSRRLADVFAPFDPFRDRFDLIVELVENDQVRIDTAQREIEALRARGIRTYIDDFGAGYSNIANLAALSVDGVKLDRAFAMSPDGSLMAQLLSNIIDMIHTSGRAIVVEGVETAERLETIRATGRVDYAQGYYISHPLEIGQLQTFIASRERMAAAKPARRLAAVS
jgi:sensor c-di-GMP phosphodiesterase-like protein